jgi:hypothetical protein
LEHASNVEGTTTNLKTVALGGNYNLGKRVSLKPGKIGNLISLETPVELGKA